MREEYHQKGKLSDLRVEAHAKEKQAAQAALAEAGYVARAIDEQKTEQKGPIRTPMSGRNRSPPGQSARDRVMEAAAKASRRNADRMATQTGLDAQGPLEGADNVHALQDPSPKYTGDVTDAEAPKKEPKWF